MFYITKIIGQGTEADPFRSAARDVSGVTRCRACISSNADGRPTLNWSIVYVLAADYDAVANTPGIIGIPAGIKLDTVLTAAQIIWLKNKAAALGFSINIPSGITVRQLLRALIKRHYGHADEHTFPETD